MASPARIYKATLDTHRRRLARVAERRGVQQIKRLYNEAQSVLTRKLARTVRSGAKFTAQQQAVFLAQVRQGQYLLARRMLGEMGDISRDAQVEALRGLIADLSTLEHAFTGADVVLPIEEAARFRGIIDNRRASLMRAHEQSVARYTADVLTKMENELSLSMLTGESSVEAVDRVMGVADAEWWQAERIVRTESTWAFNATQHDGMREASVDLPDLMMRWNEYVSDDGEPLDSRVAPDSVALHGQVAAVGSPFVFPTSMPDGTPIPKTANHLRGKTFMFPPNRPNDRATLSPWRPHWGVPGWRWVNGQRVELG